MLAPNPLLATMRVFDRVLSYSLRYGELEEKITEYCTRYPSLQALRDSGTEPTNLPDEVTPRVLTCLIAYETLVRSLMY
jgi:hypothetical protein